MKRTLILRRENLAPLTGEDLSNVVGGQPFPTGGGDIDTCLTASKFVCTFECLTRGTTCSC